MTTVSNAELIGARLQKARDRKGLTQDQLSERTGIGRVHISHIECGRSCPSIDNLIKLMDCLEIEPNEVFCDVVKTSLPFILKETETLFGGLNYDNQVVVRDLVSTMKEKQRKVSNEEDEGPPGKR